jgi:hypothetical protein
MFFCRPMPAFKKERDACLGASEVEELKRGAERGVEADRGAIRPVDARAQTTVAPMRKAPAHRKQKFLKQSRASVPESRDQRPSPLHPANARSHRAACGLCLPRPRGRGCALPRDQHPRECANWPGHANAPQPAHESASPWPDALKRNSDKTPPAPRHSIARPHLKPAPIWTSVASPSFNPPIHRLSMAGCGGNDVRSTTSPPFILCALGVLRVKVPIVC